MANELTLYEAQVSALVAKNKNYILTLPSGASARLLRDTDFGKIPKTKKPTLYKSGAEKIAMAYGCLQHYTVESAIEQGGKDAFFYYRVRCDLCKIAANGMEYVLSSGYGAANSNEKRNGMNSAYDSANGSLKMAQKRALVAAAISISGVSGMFAQDLENEDFMNASQEIITDTPDSPITRNQIVRIFALAADAGLSREQAKNKIAALGYSSTKDILQKDYNAVCDTIAGAKEETP